MEELYLDEVRYTWRISVIVLRIVFFHSALETLATCKATCELAATIVLAFYLFNKEWLVLVGNFLPV